MYEFELVLPWEEYARILHFLYAEEEIDPGARLFSRFLEETSQYEEETNRIYLSLQKEEVAVLIRYLLRAIPAQNE